MVFRLAPPGLALSAVLLGAAGAEGAALGVLLLAVPVAAAAVLYAVAEVVDQERSRTAAVPAGAALLLIVLAAATRRPELALGCLVCLAADHLAAESATRKRTALSAES